MSGRLSSGLLPQLDRLRIPCPVVEGVALQHHRLHRSTQDLDLLVGSLADLDRLQRELIGYAYLRKAPDSRHLRDEVAGFVALRVVGMSRMRHVTGGDHRRGHPSQQILAIATSGQRDSLQNCWQ